jgi:hypothetical protein
MAWAYARCELGDVRLLRTEDPDCAGTFIPARSAPAVTLSEDQQSQINHWLAAMGTPQQVTLRCRIVLAAARGKSEAVIPSGFRDRVLSFAGPFVQTTLRMSQTTRQITIIVPSTPNPSILFLLLTPIWVNSLQGMRRAERRLAGDSTVVYRQTPKRRTLMR